MDLGFICYSYYRMLDASSEWKRNLKEKGIEAFSERNRISVEALVYNPREDFQCLPSVLIVFRPSLNKSFCLNLWFIRVRMFVDCWWFEWILSCWLPFFRSYYLDLKLMRFANKWLSLHDLDLTFTVSILEFLIIFFWFAAVLLPFHNV